MMNQQPMRVMKYKLVTASPEAFNDAIQGHLNDAWQPWGSPFFISVPELDWRALSQAMVKYERKQ